MGNRLKGARKARRERLAATSSRPNLTWEGLRWGTAQLCEQRGWYHGCPMPNAFNFGHRLIVAKGAPLGGDGTLSFEKSPEVRVCHASDVDEAVDVPNLVNRWTPTPVEVQVYRDSKGTFTLQMPSAHIRLRMHLDTMIARGGAVDARTELTAMESLCAKLRPSQWDSYVLTGAFPETSARSGVTYILRKGLPTIALRLVQRPEGGEQRHFLACLCLHPMAYYENTWAGSQPPTDEVIAHLMLIRANEHFFWKKAGQHPITDPRAAI